MLHDINLYVNIFHQIRNILKYDPLLDLKLVITNNRTKDSRLKIVFGPTQSYTVLHNRSFKKTGLYCGLELCDAARSIRTDKRPIYKTDIKDY